MLTILGLCCTLVPMMVSEPKPKTESRERRIARGQQRYGRPVGDFQLTGEGRRAPKVSRSLPAPSVNILHQWREERDLSRADIADLLGVSTRRVQDWFSGKRSPSKAIVEKIVSGHFD